MYETTCLFQGLDGSKAEFLKDVKFIPVANATHLAAPSRVFVRLRQDLAPFAFELPPEYSAYLSMLKEAGCRDLPASSDLLQILKARSLPHCDFRHPQGVEVVASAILHQSILCFLSLA